jgi:hypothetical protein
MFIRRGGGEAAAFTAPIFQLAVDDADPLARVDLRGGSSDSELHGSAICARKMDGNGLRKSC